jgi:hypothetical protein
MEPPDALPSFRRSLYKCLRRRSDALFELTDAILAADSAVPSPTHLSLQAPRLYTDFSPAIRLLRAKRPSTP